MFGVTELGGVSLTLRAGVTDETGVIVPHVHTVRGTIKGFEHGTVKTKDRGSFKVMMSVVYYKHEIDNVSEIEVDVQGMVLKTGEDDIWADLRNAIGQ